MAEDKGITISEEEIKDIEEKVHWFQHLVTGKNNKNFDLIKVCGLVAFIAALIFQGYVVYITGAFDILLYSTGIGVLMGSVSGSVLLKHKTEADAEVK